MRSCGHKFIAVDDNRGRPAVRPYTRCTYTHEHAFFKRIRVPKFIFTRLHVYTALVKYTTPHPHTTHIAGACYYTELWTKLRTNYCCIIVSNMCTDVIRDDQTRRNNSYASKCQGSRHIFVRLWASAERSNSNTLYPIDRIRSPLATEIVIRRWV